MGNCCFQAKRCGANKKGKHKAKPKPKAPPKPKAAPKPRAKAKAKKVNFAPTRSSARVQARQMVTELD